MPILDHVCTCAIALQALMLTHVAKQEPRSDKEDSASLSSCVLPAFQVVQSALRRLGTDDIVNEHAKVRGWDRIAGTS